TSFLAKAVMMGSPTSGPRELNLVDPDEGNDLLFEVLAHPLSERVGPDDAVLSVLRDVTDLRRAANELERQVQRVRLAEMKASSERDRLNLILENVADPILVTDERANIILMNDLTKEVEIGRLYETLKTLNSELEERIRSATADLAEQNARVQWQSQEVERANRLKSEFLASMSHELRTPINALIGYSALLIDGVLGEINERQRDALRRGRAAAEHLLALINDILDLAKIEAGKMPLHLEEVELRDVVAEVSQQIEPMVRKKALEFVVDISTECPPLHTDRTKVRQVLLNLLSNAVKFTNRGRVA